MSLLSKMTILKEESTEEIDGDFLGDIPGEERLAPDPVPDQQVSSSRRRKAAPLIPPKQQSITPKLKTEVQAEIEFYLVIAAGTWGMSDPHCADVFEQQAGPIAERLVEVLARNPALFHRFRQSGSIGEWTRLLMAVGPVAKAVYSHHVVKTVEEETPEDAFDSSKYPVFSPGYIPRSDIYGDAERVGNRPASA